MTDNAAMTLIVFGALAFAAWVFYVLASGILGLTLGEILFGAALFTVGFAIGRGK